MLKILMIQKEVNIDNSAIKEYNENGNIIHYKDSLCEVRV